jgi:hypothetical protein
MKLSAVILGMLLSLPPAYTDQNEVDRDERMETIADAVAHAVARATCTELYEDSRCDPIYEGQPKRLAALVVTKGWWESRFAKNVHAGDCRDYECDPVELANGTIRHMARSPWQIQRTSWSSDLWDDLEGLGFEQTRNAAWVATKIMSRGVSQCHTAYGALSWYGVQRCQWSGAKNRYATYKKLMEPRKVDRVVAVR